MVERFIAALMAQRYRVFTRPYELNIVGIRSNGNVPNIFDDSINVLYRDASGQWLSRSWAATTDPGTFWLQNPSNPQGTAILKAGQYAGSHMIGLHRGKYNALVQRKPVTVIRDVRRDGSLDFSGKEDTGLFGINIHRALQQGTTKFIDKFSAGCQVFANATDFEEFMALCQQHARMYGNEFTYTLVQQSPLFRLS